MSESKMHQTFEAFYGFKWMSVSDTAQQAWAAAWKASRADLVIELPQQSGANLDWNQAIRYCHQAIEARGLRVSK